MEQIGTVVSSDGKRAMVQYKRSSACGENCASCSAKCKDTKHMASVLNPIHAEVGQIVKIEMDSRSLLGLSFIAYMVPLLMMALGYIIANAIWHNDIVSDLSAVALLLLTFWVLHRLDKTISQKEKYQSRITKIIG